MSKAKSHLPEGLRTVTAHLVVPNALDAIEFYKNALGAELRSHSPGPTPRSTMHAEIRIGDSSIFLTDEMPMSSNKAPKTLGGTTCTLNVYVANADTLFNRAITAGGKVTYPLEDAFWGDRYGQFIDPFGHSWAIATHQEDLTADEIGRRALEFFAKGGMASTPNK